MNLSVELKKTGETLHLRLLKGEDPCVSAEICEVFLPLLKKAISQRFCNLSDPHLPISFAIDSLMSYLSRPEKFDPARSSLIAYLYIDACGDLLNYLDKQKKFVELHATPSEHDMKGLVDEKNPENQLIEQSSVIAEQIVLEITDSADIRFLELMLERVRETEAYAKVLGNDRLDNGKIATEVKRRKDRLKVRLKRKISRLYGDRLNAALRYAAGRKIDDD